MVPPIEPDDLWPSLGEAVCLFIEQNMVHGPGDLRGQPARIDDEKRALICRMYEVYPQGHELAGRRRFRRVALSLRKGSSKTELAAWLAGCELHEDGPVRCDGFDARGEPVGRGVVDPYIPLVAFTEEQSEELCYGALLTILQEGPLANDFDLGLTRIMRKDGTGRAVALSTAPGPRDGARTTFEVADETHRLLLPRQKQAWRTMLANLPKRKLADPWALETTTAYSPGEGSVAEDTHDYARMVEAGKVQDSKLFFFHRQASDHHNLDTPEGRRAAVLEASGPVAEWSDINGIVDQWEDPKADRTFLERVWCNRPVKGSAKAFDVERWRSLAAPDYRPPDGVLITLGFDGSRKHDGTSLQACEVATGTLFKLGLWERPLGLAPDAEWEVPVADVRQVIEDAFKRWDVWRLYADPPHWEGLVDEWAGKWPDRVVAWWTNRNKPIAYAVRNFRTAIETGELQHDGNPDITRHVGNAVKKDLHLRDEEDRPLWTIQKERPDSIHKIDGAMASILAWEARGDAVAAGAKAHEYEIFFLGGR